MRLEMTAEKDVPWAPVVVPVTFTPMRKAPEPVTESVPPVTLIVPEAFVAA